MKSAALSLLLVPAGLWGQFGAAAPATPVAAVKTAGTAKPVAGVTPMRQKIMDVEKLFDTRLVALSAPNDPVDMLGFTRGLYLANYGAVFSSEISLIVTPIVTPFRPAITPEMKAQVHQRKLDRLPALRKTMNEMMQTAVKNLTDVPDSQMFVVAVRLDYLSWEDRTGLPGLLIAMADRKSALAGNVQITEEQ